MAVDPALQQIIDNAPDDDTPPPGDPSKPASPAPAAEPGSEGWLDQQSPEVQKAVKDLRNENKNYRQRARAYEDVFEGLDPDDRQWFLDLVRDIQTAPGTAAQRAQQLVDVLAGTVEQPEPTGDDAPITRAEMNKILADFAKNQAETAQQQQQLNNVYSEAEKLGYKQNTRAMVELLWVAANECDDDIGAAHKKLQDERQAVIDEAFAKKRTDAENSPRVVTRSGSSPGGDKPITSIKEGSAALREALAAGNM